MATVEESLGAKTPLGSDLAAGVQSLSLDQTVTFTKYVRLVLPIDGYVFWVKADIVGPSALYNAAKLNAVAYDQPPQPGGVAATFVCQGSLHYAADIRQEEAETYALNRVTFTALQQVKELDELGPDEMWIGEFAGRRFSFSSLGSFYKQADLFHYVGYAVYPDMEPQIVDSVAGFSQRQIVSNSLPAWLALNGYVPFYGFGNPSLRLYPSFLVPNNLTPPYAAVHVAPETTRGLASAPRLDPKTSSHNQLCAETVRITLWGTRNDDALDFVDCVNQYSLDVAAFGIMNVPVVRDEKRTQAEIGAVAMKKVVEFEVSYVQSRINDIAQQFISRAVPNFYVDGKAAA